MKIFSDRSSRSLRKARLARLAREHQGGGGQLNFAGQFFPAAPAAPPELVESLVRLGGVRRSTVGFIILFLFHFSNLALNY